MPLGNVGFFADRDVAICVTISHETLMKKALTLSLIIPAYNEEHHLKDCLDAIAAQTVMPSEVLVIDNNSTDKTVKIAEKYPFVKIIQEPNQGVIYARNTGFNAAKSDIIGRVDAENVVSKNWVEHVLNIFQDETVAGVTGPMYF